MSLNGIFPMWLGDVGTGSGEGTRIVDAITGVVEDEPILELESDNFEVTVEENITGEAGDEGITGVIEGDIDVDMECS